MYQKTIKTYYNKKNFWKRMPSAVADRRGQREGRAVPSGQTFFIFMQLVGKIG